MKWFKSLLHKVFNMDKEFTHKVLPRMLSFLKPWKGSYYSSLIIGGSNHVAFSISIAYIFKGMMQSTINQDMGVLIATVLFISIVILATMIIMPFATYFFTACVSKMMVQVRTKVYDHISSLPIKYFDKNHVGDLFSTITNDLSVLEQFYAGGIPTLFTNIIMIIGSLLFMAYLDYRLTLVLILLSVLNIVLGIKYSKAIRNLSDAIQENLGMVTRRFTDLLTGLFTIKIFHMENLSNQRFNEYNNLVRKLSIQRTRKSAELNAGNYFIGCFNFGGVIAVGALMVANNMIDFESLATIVYLQINVNMTIAGTSTLVAEMQKSFAGAARIFALLDEKTEDEIYQGNKVENFAMNKENQQPIQVSGAIGNEIIRVEDLTFGYDENTKVLSSLNLSIEKGKVSAIVGLSGCGKSTILKLFQGFYSHYEGRITIGGKNLFEYSLHEIRNMMAYVHQEASLISGTIEENIKLGNPDASREEVIEAAKAAYADEFIVGLENGYETNIGELGGRLSGGQKQRIAIARAFLKNAPILLMDEATSALDAESESYIQNALANIMKNRTVIVVSHRMYTVENADRIFVIKEGKVSESGTHKELSVKSGLYKEFISITSNI